jgi:hypothetical protein
VGHNAFVTRPRANRLSVLALALALSGPAAAAQDAPPAGTSASLGRFVGGALAGLGAHELGHLLFDVVFDADPGIEKVTFKGLPFFAITHRADVTPRQEYVISSAGFWVQHATSEWILSAEPALRHTAGSFRKGVLAFNVGASAVYATAAFARAGPAERDTRSMAASLGIDERWVGAMILVPAVLDVVRYFKPDARWAAWSSRGAKIGLVLLVLK